MTNYCGDCAKFDKNQKEYWEERYYCTEKCKYRETNDEACQNFIKRKASGYTPSGCFITTIICEMLGYEDDCDVLKTLRFIRENILKNTEGGKKLLQEYDIIGPIISEQLRQCELIDSIILAHNYILPCYDLIKHNRYIDAIQLYEKMVIKLKIRFNTAICQANLDYSFQSPEEELGKARIRKNPVHA